MTKVVYNACYGGFSLSPAAVRRGKALSAEESWQSLDENYGFFNGPRHDSTLVKVVEELGDAANGVCAKLRIDEIPSGTPYRIDEYDGIESVMTSDAYDWTIAP